MIMQTNAKTVYGTKHLEVDYSGGFKIDSPICPLDFKLAFKVIDKGKI